jgi:outer membrane protein TolC
LTGRPFADTDQLSLPDLAPAVARAREDVDSVRARPEYEQFARSQDRLARQQDVVRSGEQPRVSAFARIGYGRPGLNFISSDFEPYGVVGVQVQWKLLTWGTPSRERQELAVQQDIVAADQAAFSKSVARATENDAATIDRLQAALTLDDRIVSLREAIEQSARVRLDEGVITATDYIDRNTELLNARLARGGHLIELAEASARLLTTLGLEVR